MEGDSRSEHLRLEGVESYAANTGSKVMKDNNAVVRVRFVSDVDVEPMHNLRHPGRGRPRKLVAVAHEVVDLEHDENKGQVGLKRVNKSNKMFKAFDCHNVGNIDREADMVGIIEGECVDTVMSKPSVDMVEVILEDVVSHVVNICHVAKESVDQGKKTESEVVDNDNIKNVKDSGTRGTKMEAVKDEFNADKFAIMKEESNVLDEVNPGVSGLASSTSQSTISGDPLLQNVATDMDVLCYQLAEMARVFSMGKSKDAIYDERPVFEHVTRTKRQRINSKEVNKMRTRKENLVERADFSEEPKSKCSKLSHNGPKKAKSPAKKGQSPKKELPMPKCDCVIAEHDARIKIGPVYTHLGSSRTVSSLRSSLEDRLLLSGPQLRMEEVVYCAKGSKTTQGCPVAKYVIRRTNNEEKLVVVVKKRPGHYCDHTWIIIALLLWDGLDSSTSDASYEYLSRVLGEHGQSGDRGCDINKDRDCACQGLDTRRTGGSFSFGCTWKNHFSGCKFGRSQSNVRRFKLAKNARVEEEKLEKHVDKLALEMSNLLQDLAPTAFNNMIRHSEKADNCRIGVDGNPKPFAGLTAVIDFCAHEHVDKSNMEGGCTVVLTLLKPENRVEKQEDEQYHILPYYKPDLAEVEHDEVGEKGLVVLDRFERTVRIRATPVKKKKKVDLNLSDEEESNCSPICKPETENAEATDSTLIPLRYSGQTDCSENFLDKSIGGLAFALTHGSVLIECAKEERHATSALLCPDRKRPTRLGLIFYQHRRLNAPHHGNVNCAAVLTHALKRDYEAWQKGKLLTKWKLNNLRRAGTVFPEFVEVVDKGGNPYYVRTKNNKYTDIFKIVGRKSGNKGGNKKGSRRGNSGNQNGHSNGSSNAGNINIHSAGGNISVGNNTGNISVGNNTGNISVGNNGGNISVGNTTGNISVGSNNGNSNLSNSGNFCLGSNNGNLNLGNYSGNVNLGINNGNLNFRSN